MRTPRLIGVLLVVAACKGGGGSSTADAPGGLDGPDRFDAASTCSNDQLVAMEQEMAAALDAAAVHQGITVDPDFTVLLETADGRTFRHSHGASSATTRYESASTSKWVTAVIILDLVDRGMLALDTTAHDVMPAYWTESAIDLRDLLSFTSGFA